MLKARLSTGYLLGHSVEPDVDASLSQATFLARTQSCDFRFGACLGHFKHGAAARGAAALGGAIEVARIVHDQASRWVGAVAIGAREAIEDSFGSTVWAQPEDRPTANLAAMVTSTIESGAIKVTLTIHDQACNRIGAIAVRAGEAVEDGFHPAWAQLENCAITIRPALGGSAIKVALTVHDQALNRPHTIVVCIAEAIKDGFPPVWAQLKNCAAAQRAVGAAATDRSPIEVSRAVHDQGRVWGCAVVFLIAKSVKDFFSTARADSK